MGANDYTWMDVENGNPNGLVVVDCGYVNDKDSRDRADRIFALGVGKSNLRWGPSTSNPRIHIIIPTKKKDKIFGALPISDKKSWFGATHSYLGKSVGEADVGGA